ncbi:MAG: SAM-dependent methyltransferase [Bdellovibrionales bacterium]|jgi:ubiquinone/menaquinone biosynthesis C-methylase UbiE|nr:SAM-dependent methyltransferase [Bdellovibrionales bacterium]
MFAPKQINESEVLDDPSMEIDTRLQLLSELDQLNHNLPVYRIFLQRFFAWMPSLLSNEQASTPIRILEVGSGSGGLALEILKYARAHYPHLKLEYSLLETAPEILAWSHERLTKEGFQASTFIADERHLKRFAPQSFDFVISLHVLHHVQPMGTLKHMLDDVKRIATNGFFMADCARQLGTTLTTRIVNRVLGTNPVLVGDAIRSFRRAYTPSEIASLLSENESPWDCSVKTVSPFPYLIATGERRGD